MFFKGVFSTQSWTIWNSLIQGTWPLLVSSARNERLFAHRCSLFRDAGRSENLGVNSNRRSFIVSGFVFRSAQIWGANYPLCPPASGVSAISVLLGLCCVKHYLLSLIFCASWLLLYSHLSNKRRVSLIILPPSSQKILPPRLLIQELLQSLLVYSNLLGY